MSARKIIECLVSDASPIRRRAFGAVVCPPLAIGAASGLVVVVMSIGLRPDLRDPDAISQLAIGGGFGLGSTLAGLAALLPSLRPDMDSVLPKRILTSALVLLIAVATTQVSTDRTNWSLVHFLTSSGCSPWMVAVLAIPPYLALAARLRSEAPTHLNVSGAALGLTSGGVGTFLHSFGCSEGSAALGLASFSVGIGLATLGGALMAPRLLRW